MTAKHSTNDRAEAILGRRLTPEQEAAGNVIPFDFPCELGYRCPVCLADDERLQWSEYASFLWCEQCDRDYPSVLCIDLTAIPDPDRPWHNAGIESAVTVFLDSVAQAIARAAGT